MTKFNNEKPCSACFHGLMVHDGSRMCLMTGKRVAQERESGNCGPDGKDFALSPVRGFERPPEPVKESLWDRLKRIVGAK